MRRLPVALALLAALVLSACLQPARSATPAPQGAAAGWQTGLVINSDLAHPAKMFEAFDTASLNLYDFNGDGQLEIVSNNDNNHFYVLDSKTGSVLFEHATEHPGGDTWPVRELNPISIGNLMGDGNPCMIVPSDVAHLTAWCFNAAASTPTSFNFTKEWDVYMDAAKVEPDFKAMHPWLYYPDNGTPKDTGLRGADGDAFMASVDGSGCKYVFAETDGFPGQFAFDCHGNYKWSHSWYDGNAGAVVVDLDHTGKKAACFASDAGEIACYDAKTGAQRWVFQAREHGAFPGSVPLAPLFADVFGTGQLYTFFGARNAVYNATSQFPIPSNSPDYDKNWMNETHAVWYLLDPKGNMLWNVSYDWMNPVQYNHPAAIDVNGDGVLDLVALDWNTIGHKPGNWEPTNRPSNLFALNGKDGSVLWHTGVPTYWSNKDFVIADATGDGEQDIIVPEPKLGYDGVGVFDMHTGKEKGWFAVAWGETRGPVGGDLYGDGKLELVVPVSKRITDRPNYRSLDVGYREGALAIISTGVAFKATFTANFWLTDDQKMVSHGTSGVPPPTPVPTPTPTPSPTPVTSTPSPTPTTTGPTPTSTTPPPGNVTTTTVATTPSTTTTTTSTRPVNATPNESVRATPSNVPAPALVLGLAAVAAVAVLAKRRR